MPLRLKNHQRCSFLLDPRIITIVVSAAMKSRSIGRIFEASPVFVEVVVVVLAVEALDEADDTDV